MKRFIFRPIPFWLSFVFWFTGLGIVNANDSMNFYQASAGNSYEATWIAAEGTITADTPQKFRDYLRKNGAEGGKVFFNSPGGNLLAGLQLGRILRDEGLAVSVGKTMRDPDGFRETLSAGVCASACAYAFLGGIDRYLFPNGWKLEDNKIGFHQFYTDSSITNALSAAEATVVKNATLSQAQFITGIIAAYIVEMGADATLLA